MRARRHTEDPLDGAPQKFDRIVQRLGVICVTRKMVRLADQRRVQSLRRGLRGLLGSGADQLPARGRNDRFGDFLLNGENVVGRAVVGLRPELAARNRVIQLGDDARLLPALRTLPVST